MKYGNDEEADPKMMAEENPHGMNSNEQCVPLEALKMPGEDEQMMTPAVGDPVNYTVEGKITRIDGDSAYVKAETVNGKPLDEQAAKTADDTQDQEKKELYDMAASMDNAGSKPAAPGMM